MKLRLLILTLLFYINAYSQYEYRPGYIVKPDGSTVEGLINFRGSEFNARKCEFKKNISADPVVYLPGDIEAYRLKDSKYFESKKVMIDNTDTTLFLECLISGKATIYFTGWNSHDHYFIEMDGKMKEIDNNDIVMEKDGIEYKGPSHQYVGVLKYFFKDCPPVVKKLDHEDFSKKSLVELSKEYHEYVCKDEQCIIYEKKFYKRHISIGADFSYGTNKLEFFDINLQMTMKSVMHYQFGINSQINIDEEGAFNLQAALRYYSYQNEILNSMYYSIGTYPSDVHYQYSILKPEIQLKYKMKIWKLVPFVSAGLFTTLFLSDKGYIYNERFNITLNFLSGGFDDNINGHINGMLGGTGEIGLELPDQSMEISRFPFLREFSYKTIP